MKIKEYIFNFFTKGNKRSLKVKKNILASFFIKGINIGVGLAIVPITIGYLNPTKYGIWITLSSLIAWFGFFDIGLGNGLRNRFTEAVAKGNHKLAKEFVSTTYAIITIVICLILLLFYIVNPFLNWNKILNVGEDVSLQTELGIIALVVFTFFCLRFIFKLITTILMADQRPAKAAMFDLVGKIISLIIIYLLTLITNGSLLYLGIVMSSVPVLVLIISNIYFFNGKYKPYRPSIKTIDLSKTKDLLNLGVKFFIIQIAAVLLYQTNNIIISQLFGPAEVTPYNVAFKYFSALMMGFSIILTPFWSAITDAWIKNEIGWIKNSMKKLFLLWGLFCIAGIIMLFISPWVYQIWVGDKVNIPFTISILVLIWILINTWNGIFGQFLNGVGKIKLQLYLGVTAALLNVPLALILGRKVGVEGVLLANILVIMVGVWMYPIQYFKLLNKKAKGIYNK